MDGELAYWSGLSGLTPAKNFSIADHMAAAGQDVPVARSYFTALSGLTPAGSFSYAEHRRAVFAGGGGPVDSPLYGRGLYGRGLYGH